jgi:peptidoglycan/LPS O-acetylase OafA/YrhL
MGFARKEPGGKMQRKNSFDLLRLIAASMVLFSHSFPLAGQDSNEPIQRFTNYGSFGGIAVDIFFIISGYLVAGSYLRGNGPVDFVLKRCLRLFPALWGAVILSVCVLGPLFTSFSLGKYFSHPQTREYLYNLFLDVRYTLPDVFASNPYPNVVNGSLWTLPLEALMYVIVLLLGVSKALTRHGCAAMIIIFAWLHFAVPATKFTQNGVVLYLMPYVELTRLGILYFSGAMFVFMRPKMSRDSAIVLALMLALFFKSSISEIVLLVTLPYIVFCGANCESRISDWMSRHGDFSYGVYVYAFPVQQTAAMLLGKHVSPALIFILSLPVTLVLAYLSWRLIEKPALRLKGYFNGIVTAN